MDDLSHLQHRLERILSAKNNGSELRRTLTGANPADLAVVLVRMRPEERLALFRQLPASEAAALLQTLPDHAVADIVAGLPIDLAADLLEKMPGDDQADILARLTQSKEEEILRAMSPEDAAEVERLLSFPPDSAGGLMVTEFLAYPEDWTVDDVIEDLRSHADEYARYEVQYVYTIDPDGRLVGVLRLRDLLMAPRGTQIAALAIRPPLAVPTSATIQQLRQTFQQRPLFGLPVVDEQGRLLGVVRRTDVEQAASEETGRTFLRLVGILTGEELRTDPLNKRLLGRSVWLVTNLTLDLLAASVIAMYQDVLTAVISLAVFLPIISDMGGNAGMQSVAVTVRELAMGLIRTGDARFVIMRELPLGVAAGAVLAFFGAGVAYIWTGELGVGFVFATALLLNTIWSVLVGATLPLFLSRVGLDPALVSGPVLTTLTDIFGFFVALELARQVFVASA